MKFHSGSELETRRIGRKLARTLKPGDILCLFGGLGAGKTVLTRGIAAGLGHDEESVRSPSFVLMNRYSGGRIPLNHFDFYRLEGSRSIPLLGYEEFLYGEAVSVIEWPERLERLLPAQYLRIELRPGKKPNERTLTLASVSNQVCKPGLKITNLVCKHGLKRR